MSSHFRRGFTLVEMLVVIGIIAILAALLLPAVNRAILSARNAAIAIEVNQLASAIESYKQDKGDYPPNFGDPQVVLRHIRKCYPKADPTYIATFVTRACTRGQTPDLFIDEGESLVFWLSATDTDPRYPFLIYYNPNNLNPSPKKYYDFDESRLTPLITDRSQSYFNKQCKDTFYIYIDSRSYDSPATDVNDLARFNTTDATSGGVNGQGDSYAYAEDRTAYGVRPYWSSPTTLPTTPTPPLRNVFKPMNPTTFQIICAGMDGDYGSAIPGDVDVKIFSGVFAGKNFSDGDNDNITNFSNGRVLKDSIPN